MASAARGESSILYGGEFATGGKFRKPTGRRSQKTPYDRPPTSVRNSGLGGGENRGSGWLSKLVDPAHRFITYNAHRLFGSVLRKRLVSDVNQETQVGHTEDTSALSMKNDVIQMEDTNACIDPTKKEFTDLEKIFKGRTYTRSDVDRLTTFLRSKAANSSTVNEEQINEVSIVRYPPSHEREREHRDNGSMNALVSQPLGSSRALEECIASPAQLAKAYMDSRPSEITPILGLRGQVVKEDSNFVNKTHPVRPQSPAMSLVPKLSGQRPHENGFVTPRPRGRSAVYRMTRTPYSRPQSTVKIGSVLQASPNKWEESLSSGSKQGFLLGLKRRSSVLDNDISVGAVRRTRQKSYLSYGRLALPTSESPSSQKSNLSSRTLALLTSESPVSVRASGGQKSTQTSKDNGHEIPGSSFNLVPSKSNELALKILQQLDQLVSPKEKSPSKLSPSMLCGPALKSLQDVEAPKSGDNLPENKENLPDSSYQKQENSISTDSKEVFALSEKTGVADGTSKTDSNIDQETPVIGATDSLEKHPPKQRGFQIRVDEDLFMMDDDHDAAKQNSYKVEKCAGISKPNWGKSLRSSVAMPSTSYLSNGDASQGTSNGSLESGKSKFAVEADQQSTMASESTSKFIQGTEKSSISTGRLTSEEKVISMEKSKKASAVFSNVFSSPAATGASAADIKLEKTSSSAFGVSEALAKPTESMKTSSNSAPGAETTTSAAATLNGSIFSAAANAVSPPLNNGSLGSSTVQSLTATPTASSVYGKLPGDTSNDSNSQSTSVPPFSSTSPFKFGEPSAPFSASTISSSSEPISKESEVKNSTFGNINSFKFGCANTSTGNVFAAKSSESKSTPGFMFGSSSSAVADSGNNIFGGTLNPSTSAAAGSSGSLIFGVTSSSTPGLEASKFSGSSAATTTGSNIFGTSSPAFASSGSNMFGDVTASNVFGFNAVSSASAASSQSQASNLFSTATGSGTTTSTQTAPFKFGSSAQAPSFVNTSLTSFGLTKSEPSVFTSGSTSSASSSGTTSSSLFGTNWRAPNSAPVFSSSFTTSAATGSTATAPLFNASTNTPSSSPIFGFSTTPQQPVFGNSTPGFAFGATAPPLNTNGVNNNQQVNMEDNMAEDTDQTNKPSMIQPSVSVSQPSFTFSNAPVANPFQFVGQPITNTSFQTSQNLEFQGSGSFSLGSNGGGDKASRRIFKPKKTNRKK